MLIDILAAAAGDAAPESKFGFEEMMFPDGNPNWIALFILVVLVIMSVGSFYILITKLLEQNRILKQYKNIQSGTFWRAAARWSADARAKGPAEECGITGAP